MTSFNLLLEFGRSEEGVLLISLASWCYWGEMGSVPNRLGAESHTEEFRAACEEVWYQNWLLVERGVIAKIAVWYRYSYLFEGCKSVMAELAPCWK